MASDVTLPRKEYEALKAVVEAAQEYRRVRHSSDEEVRAMIGPLGGKLDAALAALASEQKPGVER
jgi:hypothetical protein